MLNNAVEILLVEDNPNDAELVIRALKKNNLSNNLLHLQDGEEAINYIFSEENHTISKLILLDLKLPKVDGLEILRKIKADSQRKKIPVVMLTSSKEERDIVESYDLGVNAYLVKPIDFDQFTKAIKDIGFFWLVLNQPPQL
jgi:two-component system response regulator